jgi:hypothetical protein
MGGGIELDGDKAVPRADGAGKDGRLGGGRKGDTPAELLRTDRLLESASLSDRQALEELLPRLWAIRPERARAA